jgi:hypothetical protein
MPRSTRLIRRRRNDIALDFKFQNTMPLEDYRTRLLRVGVDRDLSFAERVELTRISKEEIRGELNRAWRAGTIDRAVKVITLPIEENPPKERGFVSHHEGCITQEKFILDANPDEMRRILGLRAIDLTTGARVMAIEYDLSSWQFQIAGYTYLPFGRPGRGSDGYVPGTGAVQWVLGLKVPFRHIGDVKPGERYDWRRKSC